jgi:molybdenum cofactor cytidylyltransferase
MQHRSVAAHSTILTDHRSSTCARQMRDSSCASIVLAAGESKRLGQPKQLLKINGESMVRRTVRLALEAGSGPVLVVTGAHSSDVYTDLVGMPVETIFNANWRQGMGTSLRCAAENLAARKPWPASVLVLVCDQPMLTAEHLKLLIEAQHGNQATVAASYYGGRFGVPAVFASSLLPMLMECSGDSGARHILRTHHDSVFSVDFPGGLVDIDTPEDLRLVR